MSTLLRGILCERLDISGSKGRRTIRAGQGLVEVSSMLTLGFRSLLELNAFILLELLCAIDWPAGVYKVNEEVSGVYGL